MKLAVGLLVFLWVFTGLLGAWWMDELDADHLKTIALGPISLAQAYNDNPVSYPGPN